ncbi:ATP-binding protein [Cellulomonas sp. NS3]|uniref:ATP-binding protein n=1 Tax=Cellulomonas sp. NS3 TaxID=2973977 RepID=UPI0021617ED1|nr:ATP-binding protein [Cellulomonas sp. NS3]
MRACAGSLRLALDRGLTAPVHPAPQPGAGGYGSDVGAQADPRFVTYARQHVVINALRFGASLDASFTIEVLTSELVTKAVLHGRACGYVQVRASYSGGAFTVAVSDQNPQLPILRQSHPERPVRTRPARGPHPRHRLGIDPATTGKTVWFTLRLAHGHDQPVRDA